MLLPLAAIIERFWQVLGLASAFVVDAGNGGQRWRRLCSSRRAPKLQNIQIVAGLPTRLRRGRPAPAPRGFVKLLLRLRGLLRPTIPPGIVFMIVDRQQHDQLQMLLRRKIRAKRESGGLTRVRCPFRQIRAVEVSG